MTLAGLRPGEKLFEEKLMAEEGLKKTKNKLIHIGCPIPFKENGIIEQPPYVNVQSKWFSKEGSL